MAIVQAYTNDDFKILLREKMDKNLDEIAGDGYNMKVFNLIDYLDRKGELEKFIRVIVAEKPNSPYLDSVKKVFHTILIKDKLSNFFQALQKLNYSKENAAFCEFIEKYQKPVGAFCLYGEQGSGQKWLLNKIFNTPQYSNFCTSLYKIQLEITRSWSLDSVWERFARKLGVAANPEAIAEALYQHWQNPVTVLVILSGVEYLKPDEITSFIKLMWQPLSRKACECESYSRFPLVLFLLGTDSLVSLDNLDLALEDTYVTPETPVRLPINRFSEKHLNEWQQNHRDILGSVWRDFNQDAFRAIIDFNARSDACNEEILTEICAKCGFNWDNDIVPKLSI